MPIVRMNHAVLFVRDAAKTASFYRDVLGFRDAFGMEDALFMQAPGSKNDHDIAFFSVGETAAQSAAGRETVGLYHIAWEVESLRDLRDYREKLEAAGALTGATDHGSTKSLYGSDPDGLEFEIMWPVPEHLLKDGEREARATIKRLDLDKEIARFGLDTKASA
jgi:catechol-2,3-dioxygenase